MKWLTHIQTHKHQKDSDTVQWTYREDATGQDRWLSLARMSRRLTSGWLWDHLVLPGLPAWFLGLAHRCCTGDPVGDAAGDSTSGWIRMTELCRASTADSGDDNCFFRRCFGSITRNCTTSARMQSVAGWDSFRFHNDEDNSCSRGSSDDDNNNKPKLSSWRERQRGSYDLMWRNGGARRRGEKNIRIKMFVTYKCFRWDTTIVDVTGQPARTSWLSAPAGGRRVAVSSVSMS